MSNVMSNARNIPYQHVFNARSVDMSKQVPLSMYSLPTYNETDSESEEWLSQRIDLQYGVFLMPKAIVY
jgi:hypothetical protein